MKALPQVVMLAVGIAAALWLSAEAHGRARRPITLEDLQALDQRRINNLELSPDGLRIIYTIAGPASSGEIWMVDAESKGAARKLADGAQPHWSPDSRRVAYYAHGAEGRQLWVLNVASGQTRQVTRIKGGITRDAHTRMMGSINDVLRLSWSPDSTRIAFVSKVDKAGSGQQASTASLYSPKPGEPLVLTNDTPHDWTLHGIYRAMARKEDAHDQAAGDAPPRPQVNQLFVVSVETLQLTQLTTDEDNYFNPHWSPDGTQIVSALSKGRSLEGPDFRGTDLCAIDVATGAKTALTASTDVKRLPLWSPDGRWIAYIGGETRLTAPRAFVMPATGGAAVDITRALPPSASNAERVFDVAWMPDSRSLVVKYKGVSTLDRVTGELRSLFRNTGAAVGSVSVSRKGELAWDQSSESTASVVHLLKPGAREPQIVLDVNPQMRQWALGAQELVTWKNSRGQELHGVLIKPAGYRRGQKVPLIVDCYPGYGKEVHAFYGAAMAGNQALASRGYAVFFPAHRAPHVWMNLLRTRAFMDEAKGPQGWDTAVDDVQSGVDELIRRGMVDEKRMCLTGFSNGGGIVNYLVTATDRFRCAVSVAPVFPNWTSRFFLPTPGTQPSNVVEIAGIGTTPWDDPEGWIRLSAVTRLPNVTTPMLLAVGDDDLGFLFGTLEMYNGLRFLGREVTLLRYANQGHGFGGAALRDFWERRNEFLDRYLQH